MQPRICFKITQGITEWNSNKWSKFTFSVQVLKRKSGVYISKAFQGNDKWRKGTEEENPKKYIFVSEIHYSKYQLIKKYIKQLLLSFCRNHLKFIAIQRYIQAKHFLIP